MCRRVQLPPTVIPPEQVRIYFEEKTVHFECFLGNFNSLFGGGGQR